MISFLPFEEKDGVTFKAFDSETELGSCRFTLSGYDMLFTAVSCEDDIMAEGLARAAMNYAANRNAYIAKIGKDIVCPAFLRLGFEGDEILSAEIPQALSSGCSCGHN